MSKQQYSQEELKNAAGQISKQKFIEMLFTSKKLKWIPNKNALVKQIQNMSDIEFEQLIKNSIAKVPGVLEGLK